MTTKEGATTILRTWDSLRAEDISADEAREIVGRVRDELGEAGYQFAKFAAAAADSRRA